MLNNAKLVYSTEQIPHFTRQWWGLYIYILYYIDISKHNCGAPPCARSNGQVPRGQLGYGHLIPIDLEMTMGRKFRFVTYQPSPFESQCIFNI